MNYDAFRANLKDLLNTHGYSAKALAEELDCVPATISRYLTGVRQPDLPYVLKIAAFFDVSIDWLMGNCGDKFNILPTEYQELVRKYSLATTADRKVVDAVLEKYE